MDFRFFLGQELQRRQSANVRYSLRAFAKHLKTDPSTLSQFLRGKRPFTPKAIGKIGTRLGLRANDLQSWIDLEKDPGANPRERELQEDEFRVIADWYHYAIFELFAVRGFKPEPKAISRCLGITAVEARAALDRLTRLGALREERGRGLKRTTNYLTTHRTPHSNSALRMIQNQVLDLAKRALEDTPYGKREQVALTIAARESDLPKIREKIRKFHKQLNDWIERRGGADTVYHLATTYYPVSTSEKKK